MDSEENRLAFKKKAKRKYEDEHWTFLSEREELYFFVERNGKLLSLVCQTSLSHFKVSNLEQHFSPHNANRAKEFPKGTELRKQKVNAMKRQSEKQTQLFWKFTKHSETVTMASYQLAWNIACAKKPYSEGEFMKSCICNVTDILNPDNNALKTSFLDLQMSRHTFKQRISDIENIIETAAISALLWMNHVTSKISHSWQYLCTLCQKTVHLRKRCWT